nr:MAG TPA: hypothetical protein [Caudoviricetes sp.]
MDVQSQIEDLKGLVAKLKKNKECVPIEDLKTKYKKAYDKLKIDIKVLAEQIMEKIINEELHFINDEEGREAYNEIQDLVNKIGSEGESKKLGRCLTKEYDVDGFLLRVENIRGRVMDLYAPYEERYRFLRQERQDEHDGGTGTDEG